MKRRFQVKNLILALTILVSTVSIHVHADNLEHVPNVDTVSVSAKEFRQHHDLQCEWCGSEAAGTWYPTRRLL